MPWVEKRKNGYRLVVDVGVDTDGKRIRKTQQVDTTSKREAKNELRKFVSQLEEAGELGVVISSDQRKSKNVISFMDHIEKWINMFVLTNLEITTQGNYLFHLEKRIIPYFKDFPNIKKIEPIDIVEYLHNLKSLKDPSKPAGDQTKVYVYRILKSIFSKASEWYRIENNPMKEITRPKIETMTDINVYDEEESNEVFRKLQQESPYFRTLISLTFTTGMRRAELLGLEWKHIDFDRGVINIRQSIPTYKDGVPVIKSPKTKGSIRTVSIPQSIILELKEYKKEWNKLRTKNINIWKTDREFLLCNKYGMPYYPKTISDQWRSFIRRTKLRYIRFHDLRHTSVTILINRGIHAKIISERIGHSKIGTTMDVYGHVIRAADAGAAATFDDVFSSTSKAGGM